MKPIKAVIFDLDGTLLDTIADIADSMNRALSLFGFRTFNIAEYKLFVGRGVDVLVDCVLGKTAASEKTWNAVRKMYLKTYAEWQSRKTQPYSGIVETVMALKAAGIVVNVLSNKPDPDTKAVVDFYFPARPFTHVIGQRPGHAVKPDPSSAEEIVALLGCDKEEVLYVGDTATDMMTATNAGLESVGVLWGFRDQEELEAGGAIHLIERPEELLTIVARRGTA